MALMLVELAAWPANDMTRAITRLISVGMFTGTLKVLIGTRGLDPGWIAMTLVALQIDAGL